MFTIQGEYSVNMLKKAFLGEEPEHLAPQDAPGRPPLFCAGCPHRPLFYVLGKLKKTVTGDIGCYTLGALAPLSAIDTCMCMEMCIRDSSPSHGAEKNGPTQAALSVAGLDHLIITNGSQYNQKYHPSALAGEKGLRSLVDVIETFFEAGGYHLQFNVVSADTLRAAQREPQAYRDLVVRVAGYTAFFVDLNRELQNDIIERTEMEFA